MVATCTQGQSGYESYKLEPSLCVVIIYQKKKLHTHTYTHTQIACFIILVGELLEKRSVMALNFWQLLSLSVIAPFFYRIGMTMCPFKEPTFPLPGICTGEVKLCVQRLVSVFSILLVQLQAI